ncbi:MAG: recombinase RecT [Flavobacteriaceae bacterium]|nr:recombinase RecT [Flavobacteriaceae bacterium]
MENKLTTKDLFGQKSIQQRFEAILGKKAQGFISSVLQVINSSKILQNADPQTVLNAAATAASLDLPINPNLGFAWIVPYKGQAQFQMGWKGFVQLALRTGQYYRINVTEVYENQFKSFNRLTEELIADFDVEGNGDIVGYAAYFRLVNGLEKMTYWSKQEVVNHAKKYSQAYGKGSMSPWNDPEQFHAMAKKTVLKNTISKWGIMSIEMQTAQLADQAVQNEEGNYQYIDNEVDVIDSGKESKEQMKANGQPKIELP